MTGGRDARTGEGMLSGIRVIDLTRVLGGPFCTQILADHGAEVIKVEPPQGDEVRDWGPPFLDGDASYFIGINRNKRSIGIDLARPAGRELLLALLEGADVLVENMKPGTLEAWGLGRAFLAERFPRLVHCSITGFGPDGPLGGRPGYDAVIQGLVGMFSINGDPECGPTRIGIPLVDIGTGLYAAIAILMALIERQRSGRGQHLDVALFDCGLAMMHPHAANFFLSGEEPKLTGSAHPNISPYDVFRTGTVPLFLAVGNDRAFARLCEIIGAPELARDPRFATNADRVVNRAALKAELERALAAREGARLWQTLIDAGVPAGPLFGVKAAIEHPHTAHRDMIVERGRYRGIGTPIKPSRSTTALRRVPPRFAEHTEEILDEAGIDPELRSRAQAEGALPRSRRRQS
ncbi:MAG: CoA transferase [Geminicoccaceae bacterium]|nr:CoA transferase [Geminicoccaceae bacterium]